MEFASFDTAAFLRDYWQKRPLLIRNPWTAWGNPLSPDELAGLACEPEVESRLVTYGSGAWDLEQGPLPESRFGELGKAPWTLLVQAVDHHVPEVAALLAPFRFVPNWRIDDVMVSYADHGGGVGPHFDQYDVFLLQGLGRRRWQIGGLCDAETPLLPHDDLRLLADFTPTEEWELEPGDILYLPPRIAHNGVAVGDQCMTYSIGFRAPSRGELITAWAEHAVAGLSDDDRYADPDLAPQANPGEITPVALASLQAMVAERAADPQAFAQWFGTFATTRRNAEIDWRPETPVERDHAAQWLIPGSALLRNPASRTAFIRTAPDAVTLFVDGQSFACTGAAAELAAQLAAEERVEVNAAMAASGETLDLVTELLNSGCLAFDLDA